MLAKVISGGQTGVDQAALRAAKACGILTGGTAAKNFTTEDGPAPWLAGYGLVAMDTMDVDYPARTRANVAGSDCTIWFGDSSSPGGRLTASCCRRAGRSFGEYPVKPDVAGYVARWLASFGKAGPFVLNVAGNRESASPGIGLQVESILREAFVILREAAS